MKYTNIVYWILDTYLISISYTFIPLRNWRNMTDLLHSTLTPLWLSISKIRSNCYFYARKTILAYSKNYYELKLHKNLFHPWIIYTYVGVNDTYIYQLSEEGKELFKKLSIGNFFLLEVDSLIIDRLYAWEHAILMAL